MIEDDIVFWEDGVTELHSTGERWVVTLIGQLSLGNGKFIRTERMAESGGYLRKSGNVNRDRIEESVMVPVMQLDDLPIWKEKAKQDITKEILRKVK